ncbi:integrase, catalytic region, zinc finger, CCHC-type containing protein [Tanacetum coccineum]
MNHVIKPVCDVDVKQSLSNVNSDILCATCNKSMFDGVHDKCLLDLVQNGNNRAKFAKKHKKQNIWKPTGHVFTEVGFKWKPTGRTFTIVGNSCPLTRFTSTNVVPPKQTTSHSDDIQKPELKVYSMETITHVKHIGSSKIAKIVESKNANHSEPNQTWGSNATDIPSSSSLVMTGTVRFGNDQIARIMRYGDYQLGNVIISRVYYVEGLGHNLFSVGQFCDADLEVAFRKNTCFIRNLEGVDLLSGSRDTNLYTISLDDMLKSSPICLLSKASKTKSWLWHRRLSHLNFGTLNKLAKDDLARGIPMIKFQKDHLIPRGLKPKEETFQVVLDALALTPCYPAFLITADVPEVYIHQFWNKHDDFYRFKIDKKKRFKLTLEVFKDIYQICPRVSGRDFDVLPSEKDTISFLIDLGYTGVINSLNDVVIDQMHQPWRTFAAIINRSLSGKTSGLDKLREVPPRNEEPIKKGKRLKTPTKKSASKPATGIVIREPLVETKSKRKEKEKVDVAHGKGIRLLYELALSKKAQMKEARMKSLRDFHKTYPSGSGTVAKKPPSVEKITPIVASEGTGDKPGVPDVTNDDSSERESESWGNDEDDSNNEQESSDESKNESEDDEMKSDEEQGMDDTTYQFDDDADARLEEPTKTATGIVQGEGNDAEMTEAQQGNTNLETTQEQVVEDAHVTIFTVPKKTEVPVTSSSRSSDLASKFLIFLDIPQTDAKIVSPLDVHVHHEVPRTQAPTLLTIPVLVIPKSSPVFTNIPQSSYTFTPTSIQATPTPPPTIETTNPLSNLPDFSSVF